jgi:hypothetical protein
METEDLRPPEKIRGEQGGPPALLSYSPGQITLTTERGQEAPLGLAGYRLNLGTTYQLRVTGPVQEIRLVGYPSLLVRPQGEAQVVTKHGIGYHYQALRVKPMGLWGMVKNLGIYPEELEVEAILQEDSRKVTATVPVVLELGFTWRLVLLLILWALTASAWGIIWGAVRERKLELFLSPEPWLGGLFLALLYPIVTFVRRVLELRRRAKELRQQFRTAWSKPGEIVASCHEE